MQNLRGAALTVLQAHQDFVLLGSLQERFGCIKSAKAGVNGKVIFMLHLCVCVEVRVSNNHGCCYTCCIQHTDTAAKNLFQLLDIWTLVLATVTQLDS
jgi:hypothetical protein